MAKTILVQFREEEERRKQFKRAARTDGLTLSAWLRRLALVRVAELGDRLGRDTAA